LIRAPEVLELWERASGLDPQRRALEIAAAAEPTTDPADLAVRPLGQRAVRLLDLRAFLGGTTIEATAVCPGCDRVLEFEVDTDDLRALATADESARTAPRTIVVRGHEVVWRCVTAADLEAVGSLGDAASAESALLDRCIDSVKGADGDPDLESAVRDAVVAAMEAADPLAEVRTSLSCGDCGQDFDAELDLAEFAWTELHVAAQRLLWDVDTLARTYGWTEPDVLALSPRRRRAYVDMAVGGRG